MNLGATSNRRRHSATMSRLPREARDGVMRVWLEILRERHPSVTWVPLTDRPPEDDENLAVSQVEATSALVT
jgi:hypothetical protein